MATPIRNEGKYVRWQLGSRRWSVEYLEQSLEIVTGIRRQPQTETIRGALLQNSDDRLVVGVHERGDAGRTRESHESMLEGRCASIMAECAVRHCGA